MAQPVLVTPSWHPMVQLSRLMALCVVSIVATASGVVDASQPSTIRIGALFPLSGAMASLAQQEYQGVLASRDLVNSDGGVAGRAIEIDSRQLTTANEAPTAIAQLRRDGVGIVIGTYSSALSIPASAAAAQANMTYWEAGAVADRVTSRGLSNVFRVGASGANLGANSATFAAQQLAPRLGKNPTDTRVSVVWENDDYGRSVADAAISTAQRGGMPIVSRSSYNAYLPDWNTVLADVRNAHPDVLILASYIPDGVQFRQAMLAANLHVGAFIGSTMAECGPEFGAMLGPDAVGVFASDRPGSGFNPSALSPTGLASYSRFAALWKQHTGHEPTEEAIAGFSAGWALFHYVLPRAVHAGGAVSPSAQSVATAAQAITLPNGTLPNGAGLQFARDSAHLGQNMLAAAEVWQWQGVRQSITVWPAPYATGDLTMVPLPR